MKKESPIDDDIHKSHSNNKLGHIDIEVIINGISIIVYNNCTSILISGNDKKIEFDFPFSSHPLAQGEHEHQHIKMEEEEHSHEDTVLPHHEHTHGTDDEHIHGIDDEVIDLSCDGVKILLCDCCTILIIKSEGTNLNFPLKEFQKASFVLSEEGDYYKREYFLRLLKNKINERDQQLFVNGKRIEISYNAASKLFYYSDSLNGFHSALDIAFDVIRKNPDLLESPHHH